MHYGTKVIVYKIIPFWLDIYISNIHYHVQTADNATQKKSNQLTTQIYTLGHICATNSIIQCQIHYIYNHEQEIKEENSNSITPHRVPQK